MKTPLRDIINNWIGQLCLDITIYAATESPAGIWTLNVNKLLHAQALYNVTIGGNIYVIQSFNNTPISAPNNPKVYSLVVKGTATITVPVGGLVFTMYPPKFFFGTIREVEAQLIADSSTFNCWPMIWMKEQYTETFHEDPNPLERDSTVSLFFLIKGSTTDKRNQAIYDQYLYPAQRLMESFTKVINKPYSGLFSWNDNKKQESYTRIYAKQGKGDAANLFSAECVGFEMDLDLKLYKMILDCCD